MTFINNDSVLLERVDREIRERKASGLNGIIGGLECVIINTEIDKFESAIQEMLDYTGFRMKDSFKDLNYKTAVLSLSGSADILIRCRLDSLNPYFEFNNNPRSYQMPHTRMETFVFGTKDIYDYVQVQQARGIEFTTSKVQTCDRYYYIESKPSKYTGISFGIIQWKTELKSYRFNKAKDLELNVKKPKNSYLKDIYELDHVAVRVNFDHRDNGIIEFMKYTNYNFDFAIYVESLNSITNVTRLVGEKFALVFTSGISSTENIEDSGPTEQFIHNYGVRPHHMAFRTENIEHVFEQLKENGMTFLVNLIGERDKGLKQTFTRMSPNTLLVNEYIKRYDGFDGFFTKDNVTILTKSTENQ